MWDEENLYLAMKIMDDTPLVYREGFPLDELDAVIFFLSTDPDADPARTEYAASDWRIVQSAYGYKNDYEFFNYIDRSMVADTKGWDTQGEYGDELVFDDYEAAITQIEGGIVWESKPGTTSFLRCPLCWRACIWVCIGRFCAARYGIGFRSPGVSDL